ncbi:MAG: hypothetical protein WDM70_11390 [Nitrosomonadales bacterium]
MNRIIVHNTYKATFSIGLQVGYSNDTIEEYDVIKFLQQLQNILIAERHIYMSANYYTSNIVLGGQIEPHLTLKFINYPQAPLHEDEEAAEHIFKDVIENIVRRLMDEFNQNRVVIQFHDSNVMLENSYDIDPRIRNTPLST